MLSNDAIVYVGDEVAVFVRISTITTGTKHIDKVNHAAVTNVDNECSIRTTREGEGFHDLVGGDIDNIHAVAIPAVVIGVGEDDCDTTHIGGSAVVGDKSDGVGPVTGRSLTTDSLHHEVVGSAVGKVVDSVGVGDIADHRAVEVQVEVLGIGSPADGGAGASLIIDSKLGGLGARDRSAVHSVENRLGHSTGAREDFLAVDVFDNIGGFAGILASHPRELNLTAVADCKGLDVEFILAATSGTVEVFVGESAKYSVGQNILHLDGIAIPAIAPSVGELEGEQALVVGQAHVGGEADRVGPLADGVSVADSLHLHLVGCTKRKVIDGVGVGDIADNGSVDINVEERGLGSPAHNGGGATLVGDSKVGGLGAGGDVVDTHVVDVQVVVSIACCRLAVECDGNALAGVVAQVDGNMLTDGSIGNIIVDILRTGVVPLAQDTPCLTVGGDEDNELVVGAGGLGSAEGTAVGGQSQVEAQLHVGLHIDDW